MTLRWRHEAGVKAAQRVGLAIEYQICLADTAMDVEIYRQNWR